jgi:hypothetical protein
MNAGSLARFLVGARLVALGPGLEAGATPLLSARS